MSIINPYRFAAAGSGIPTPIHWWDLDNITTGLDDIGSKAGTNDMTLTTGGTPFTDTGDAPDGTSNSVRFPSLSDYLETSTEKAWDGTSGAISVSVWMKIESIGSTFAAIISWRDEAAANDRLLDFRVTNDAPDVGRFIVFDDGATEDNVSAVATTDSGAGAGWIHMVGVFDGTDTATIYINAVSEDTDTDASFESLESTATMPFRIGNIAWDTASSSFRLGGNVNSFGLFDAALTQDDITALYNSGNGGYYSDFW